MERHKNEIETASDQPLSAQPQAMPRAPRPSALPASSALRGLARATPVAIASVILLASCVSGNARNARLESTSTQHARDLRLLQREHARNPADVAVRMALAEGLWLAGRFEEGVALVATDRWGGEDEQPLRLAVMRDVDAARKERSARSLLALDPHSRVGYFGLLHALRMQTRHDEFLSAAARWGEFHPFGEQALNIANALTRGAAAAGDVEQAIAWAELVLRARIDRFGHVHWADVHWLASLYEGSEQWPGAAERLRGLVPPPEGVDLDRAIDVELPAGVVDADRPRPLDVRAALGLHLGIDRQRAEVLGVASHGAARAAGLEAGDVVLTIDGRVPEAGRLPCREAIELPAGVEVAFQVLDPEGCAAELRGRAPSVWESLLHAQQRKSESEAAEDLAEGAWLAEDAAACLGIEPGFTSIQAAAKWRGYDRVWEADPSRGTPEKRINKALLLLDGILTQVPGFAHALREKARVLAGLGRLDEALAAFEQLQGLEPEEGSHVAEAGLLRMRLGQVDEASRAFERAVVLGQGGPALDQLADLLDARQAQRNKALASSFLKGFASGLTSGLAGAAAGGGSTSQASLQHTRTMYSTGH